MDAKESQFSEYLKQYITPHKLSRIEEVLASRTRYFTVVLEDIYKPHNASAVLRTADCFGIQDVHVIEKANRYKVNPYVTRGAAQWVNIHRYAEPAGSAVSVCFEHLRSQGYQIMATSPRSESLSIQDYFPDRKTALVFGNEHEGVSEEVIKEADGLIHIPMYGFTESFNISVTASIFLYDFLSKLRGRLPEGFFLEESEKQLLRYHWYQEIVKNAQIHRKSFFGSNETPK